MSERMQGTGSPGNPPDRSLGARAGIALLLLASLLLPASPSLARFPDASLQGAQQSTTEELVQQLEQVTAGQVRIAYHAQTGKVRFLGTSLEQPIPQAEGLRAGASPEQAARRFLDQYGALFGLTDQAQELETMRLRTRDQERSFVRFQQVFQGVPVLAGELIVQTDAGRNVISASGEILPELALDASPAVDAAQAQARALDLVARGYGLPTDGLVAGQPELWIYNPILLKRGPDLDLLVWRIEVRATGLAPVHELVLVDAQTGIVALHFNQIDSARDRDVYDNENNRAAGLPGLGPVRQEGDLPTGIADVDLAYDYSGDTYDFYANVHGRDSLDDAGMTLISTVRYCPIDPTADCPYPNAFWNGQQMVYGEGYAAADDVVGHELTHGVTSHESNLFYYMQSGAISESLSDIWGEFVDLTNGAGNDSPTVRWLMGEDLTGGAGRSMSHPPLFGDPDMMSSSDYVCGEPDNGGVHSNSGIGNKAAYLMVDGGSFNDQTVAGIGIDKAATIWYEVQTNLLTSGGDYQDLSDNLQQACTDLVGTAGITAFDCQQVAKAVQAVEMDQQPSACPATEVASCPDVARTDLWFDDMEAPASGNWAHSALSGTDHWYYPQTANPFGFDATYTTSGQYNIWGYDQNAVADYLMAMTADVDIPSGGHPYLQFNHAFAFDDYLATKYDGGVLEYSTNGGANWQDAGSLSIANGYNGAISTGEGNPLGGRPAFVGESNGYRSSRVDLSSLAGQSVRFRFRIGSTDNFDAYGWFLDDVHFYSCAGSLTWRTYLPVVIRNWPPPETLPPTADACVLSGAPGANFSTQEDMWVGYDHCYGAGAARSLVKFDTSSVPAGTAITSATLYLYLANSCDMGERTHQVTIHRITGPWGYGSVTWNNQPGTAGPYGSAWIPSRSWGWYGFDVTALVQGWINGSFPDYGLMVRSNESSGNDSARLGFYTLNAGPEVQPVIQIIYPGRSSKVVLPEPVSFEPSDCEPALANSVQSALEGDRSGIAPFTEQAVCSSD
jgi:bacillolysin